MWKTILIASILIALMAWAGWLTFRNSPSEATMTLETSKMQSDAARLVSKGRQVVQEVREELPVGPRDAPYDPTIQE